MTVSEMNNKRKFFEFKGITTQSIIDWLDGCAISFVITEKNMDSIDGQYSSKETCYGVFSKERYKEVFLSNARWIDKTKSFVEEFEKKKNRYWPDVSKNAIRKCKDANDMIRMIIRVFSPYFNFKIDGRRYDFIRIKSIISKHGYSVYVHDKSNEINTLKSEIRKMEEVIKHIKSNLDKKVKYQSIYESLRQTTKQ